MNGESCFTGIKRGYKLSMQETVLGQHVTGDCWCEMGSDHIGLQELHKDNGNKRSKRAWTKAELPEIKSQL